MTYNETFRMPEGGFVIEAGEKVRILATGLLSETPATATNILTGIGHASAIRFQARCFAVHHWHNEQNVASPVLLPANQGLLTGAIPATEGANQVTIPFCRRTTSSPVLRSASSRKAPTTRARTTSTWSCCPRTGR